ncbi:DMT family transporter [Oceanobacillus chungangensis]|uniref:EamA/RhaT family transporter n=1 Tax=Oceanobacillus chungangensis TaxID=1229152 RepID=A0A3D8PX71_9BACI|nr:DMT family transporter [Oceanobacillus chungangensis]RDW20736.1 EamA/RhaT family transporter [Oceanobacillus chungangensis]
MKSIYEKKWAVILIAIFCSVLWGSAFPVLKISYEELQMAPDDTIAKMVLAGMRFLLAGIIILAGLVITNPKRLLVTRKQIPVLILLGIFQTTVQYYFFYNGLANVTGMQGAILSSAGTFFVVILAHFFYKNDRLDWKKSIGLIAGFAGIIVANWGQGLELSFQLDGEGFMILSAVAAAIATIMAKELAVGIHPFTLTGWQLSIGAAVMLLIGLPQLSENAMSLTPLGWGLFIYSALLSAVAFALWYSILKYNKAGEIAIYKFITPVSGALLSAMLIPGEAINVYIVGAIALVAVGIVALNYRGGERKK